MYYGFVDANFPEFCLQTECLVLGTSGDNSCNVMSMCKAYIFSCANIVS